MNPFLSDPVATPLDPKHNAHWTAAPPSVRIIPSAAGRAVKLKRQARAMAMAAGLAVGLPAHAIDVNVASVTQLESLKGVGPRTAKMIIQERTRAGLFASMEDLSDRVRGLGERRIRALQAAGLEVNVSGARAGAAVVSADIHASALASSRSSKRMSPLPVVKPEIIAPGPF